MTHNQSFKIDLSFINSTNHTERPSVDYLTSRKYRSHLDKPTPHFLDKNPYKYPHLSSTAPEFSILGKLPDQFSNIWQTLSNKSVISVPEETRKHLKSNKSKNQRLKQLCNIALSLRIPNRQDPEDVLVPASVRVNMDRFSKIENKIPQNLSSCYHNRKSSKNDYLKKEIKTSRDFDKRFDFEKSYSANIEQQILKIREEHLRLRKANTQLSQRHNLITQLRKHSAMLDNKSKECFSKKKHYEFCSPKIEKISRDITPNSKSKTSPTLLKTKRQESLQFREQSFALSSYNSNKSHQISKLIQEERINKLCDNCSINDFRFGKILGKGRFGVVYLAFHRPTGGAFAIKTVNKQMIKANKLVQQFILEVKFQSYLDHPFILKTYSILNDQQNIYIIMQYLQQGCLFNYLKSSKSRKLTEFDTAEKIRYLAESIKYLQDRGIAHRDIKPQNIIMNFGVCKLADFGWATFCDEQRRKTYCGTCDYVAPEIIQGFEYDGSVDLWCIGVLAYELMAGKAPFYHMSIKQTRNKIMNVSMTYPEDFSRESRSFIEGLIQKEPGQRMSIEQVLEHSFLSDVNLCQ